MGSAINYLCSCGLRVQETDTSMLLSGMQRVVSSGESDYCPDCREIVYHETVDRTFPKGRDLASTEEVSEWHKEAQARGEEIYETIYSPCQKCGGWERKPLEYYDQEGGEFPSFDHKKRLPICPRCEKAMQFGGQMMID